MSQPSSLASSKRPIPARVETATLAKYFLPGDAAVVIKLLGVGNTAPFYLSDKQSRLFVLRWDSRAGGHTIRIPHSLWQAHDAKMAHDLMDQRRLPNAMIVTFELPAPVPAVAGVAADAAGGVAAAPVPAPASTCRVPSSVIAAAADAANTEGIAEAAAAGATPHTSFSNKMGATEPSGKARIVVGPGPGRRPVAPTSRKARS